MWTPTFWPSYDYPYGAYDSKPTYYRQTCQPYPVYRVPPVFHPSDAVVSERFSETYEPDVGIPAQQSDRQLLSLDGGFSQRRCPVFPGEAAPKKGESQDCAVRGCEEREEEEEEGGGRRASTPDSTYSDTHNVRSNCRVLTFQGA